MIKLSNEDIRLLSASIESIDVDGFLTELETWQNTAKDLEVDIIDTVFDIFFAYCEFIKN